MTDHRNIDALAYSRNPVDRIHAALQRIERAKLELDMAREALCSVIPLSALYDSLAVTREAVRKQWERTYRALDTRGLKLDEMALDACVRREGERGAATNPAAPPMLTIGSEWRHREDLRAAKILSVDCTEVGCEMVTVDGPRIGMVVMLVSTFLKYFEPTPHTALPTRVYFCGVCGAPCASLDCVCFNGHAARIYFGTPGERDATAAIYARQRESR